MNSNGGTLRLAVLIDGENIPAKDAGPLFAQVAKLGNPIIRRVYGDFTKGNFKDWPKIIDQHGGKAEQSGHTSTGKSASDIALVVDAMDFLHKRLVDGFCIVTGDGDFTSFAKRAREEGFKVYCFAHGKAAESLKAACDSFFSLAKSTPKTAKTNLAKPAAQKPAVPKPQKPRQPDLARPWIKDALPTDGNQWMTLSALGQALGEKHKGYLKKTGCSSLKKILKSLPDQFEMGLAADGKTEQVRRRA
ncbi:NYN domain-containing protein [Sandarakinorhabdus oryzae]|uniref:NYN domain-containing protein n=1 Tax=Sandarakinorhabdus oryzae TaxID=2675220 RepID=UPI0012E13D41|nr:NYN domain-containing protein [Sandarakinorhabdus oryzae]